MNPQTTAHSRADREQRLHEIRREAEEPRVRIDPKPSASPGASAQTGYYGTPILKRPQWAAEVPLYFFVGGLSGAASLIAAVGSLTSADARLISHSRWLAAIGGIISPALLIADLGVPSRFLNMLRVFKIQSPMSVGSWTLVAFSNSSVASAVLGEFERRRTESTHQRTDRRVSDRIDPNRPDPLHLYWSSAGSHSDPRMEHARGHTAHSLRGLGHRRSLGNSGIVGK